MIWHQRALVIGHVCLHTTRVAAIHQDVLFTYDKQVRRGHTVNKMMSFFQLRDWSLLGSLKWNLQIKDTLEPAIILSFVEKVSSSRILKTNYCYRKGVRKGVLCWEVVPFSEGPLSEVKVYHQVLLYESILPSSTYHTVSIAWRILERSLSPQPCMTSKTCCTTLSLHASPS